MRRYLTFSVLTGGMLLQTSCNYANAVSNAAYDIANTANNIAWDLYYITSWF